MTVQMLMATADDGKAAFRAGTPRDANPYPNQMSETDDWQVRKHEAWLRGWDAAHAQAGSPPVIGGAGLTILRHGALGGPLSVYRGERHLGLIFLPRPLGQSDDFVACPSYPTCETLADKGFPTEAEAIAYLTAT